MFDSESEGTAKGSLKDRLRFLAILMRISRKKKLRLNFYNINANKLCRINRINLFFYSPIRLVLDESLKTKDIIVYGGNSIDLPVILVKNKLNDNVDLELIRKVRRKKGIDFKSLTPEENAIESVELEKEKAKEELKKDYNVQDDSISLKLVNDYLAIKKDGLALFGFDVDEETKEALIVDRIKAEKDLSLLDAEIDNKDTYLGRDIDYDISLNTKSSEKLDKLLEKQKKEIEKLAKEIDKVNIKIERKSNITNFGSLLSNAIGIGVGLLTLPFSYSRTFALGTNLIRNSLNNIHNKVKINKSETKTKNYVININDIETNEKALKTSDFLLEDTLDKLDHLKYKVKIYAYKIPDVEKKLKEIEALEQGLINKKRNLSKLVETFEKNKVKVLVRENH